MGARALSTESTWRTAGERPPREDGLRTDRPRLRVVPDDIAPGNQHGAARTSQRNGQVGTVVAFPRTRRLTDGSLGVGEFIDPAVDGVHIDGGGERGDRAGAELRVVRLPIAGRAAPVVLTRRGRLVRSLVAATAVVAAGVVLFSGNAGAVNDDGAAPALVTVEAGQTLTQIAQIHLPHLPLDQAVTELQVTNRVDGSSIYAGQVLTLP